MITRQTKRLFVLIMLLVGILPSCYCKRTIDEHEIGLHMSDGISVDRTLGPGRYTDNTNWYARLLEIDTSAKSAEWTDPDVATKDKQQIGVLVNITYRRGPSGEAVLGMYQTYRSEATNDDALWIQVSSRIARILKDVTSRYSLDQLIGVSDDDTSRAQIGNVFHEELQTELDEVGVTVVDVGISNIAPSEQYRHLLEQKAAAQAAVEIAQQNRLKAIEELEQVKAETDIAVEMAKRDRLVAEEEAKVFEESPLALELEKMRITAGMYSDRDKIIIVPAGTDLSMILGGGMVLPTE